MKHTSLSLLLVFVCLFSFAAVNEGYDIKIKVTGVKKDSLCFLANYYGDKQYIQDTAKIDAGGTFEFKGAKTMPGGIYLIVLPNKKYFEAILDKEQFFSMETDTSNFIKKMKVKGSNENKLFYSYLNFITDAQEEEAAIQNLLKKVKDKKDSSAIIRKKMTRLDEEVKKYKDDFIKQNDQLFLAKVFKAMPDPEVPEISVLVNGRKDSTFAYKYFKKHFFDGIDFSDERLLRTPVFHSKLKQYLEKLTVQHPDSISAAADYLVEKARANKEMFKYVVYYLTYTYESSPIMGFDGVFVHMAKKYYLTRQAFWTDSLQNAKIVSKAFKLDLTLIGKPCPPLALPDSSNNIQSLYDIRSKYTVLFFWDPGCGHCKKTAPKLVETYNTKLKAKGVQVYAIGTENDPKEWKKFIKDNKMDFINVFDPQHKSNFKYTFDIYSTPVIYLLDEKKVIIAKRIDVEQLEEFVERLEKKNK